MRPDPGYTRYPDWQSLYQAAILEPDATKLLQRIQLAQTAILSRLQALSPNGADEAEKQAINSALHVLDLLNQIYNGSATTKRITR